MNYFNIYTHKVFFILAFFLKSVFSTAQNENLPYWVDSLLKNLTIEQKIAQLIMVAAYSNKDEKHFSELEYLVTNFSIGGIIFMQGGPARQVKLYNRLQKLSKIPLIVGFDGEWGLAMRLDSTIAYPKSMTLGAIQDNSLIYELGKQIAKECKRVGIHINFAPVVDINNNPLNPVIGFRSFGEEKAMVAQKGIAYAKGLQSEKIIAVAKHFPGHGDTETDSHYELPIINHKRQRIEDSGV